MAAGGIVAAYNARVAKRRGVASDEREVRRDAAADWSTFATEMRQALADERQDSAAKTTRIDALQIRLEAKDASVRVRDDHIDVLGAWIWERKEPPPPPARTPPDRTTHPAPSTPVGGAFARPGGTARADHHRPEQVRRPRRADRGHRHPHDGGARGPADRGEHRGLLR
jgi:hypothetical protein